MKITNIKPIIVKTAVPAARRSLHAAQKRRMQVILVSAMILATLAAVMVTRSTSVFATSVGPNNPSSGVSTLCGGGGTSWTSAASVSAQDGTASTVSLTQGTPSNCLYATGYGFSIPSTATIDGVVVTVYKSAPSSAKSEIQDYIVDLLKGGGRSGTGHVTSSAWPTTNSSTTYGSSSDLWGTSLTPTDVNGSNFGVAFAAQNIKLSGAGATLTASVDWIGITVYYHIPSLFNQASYRVFNNVDANTSNLGFIKTTTASSAASNLTTADFNNDGKKDYALYNHLANSTTFYENNIPTGSSTASFSSAGGKSGTLTGIAAADINGDGLPDFITSNSNFVSVCINTTTTGASTFTFATCSTFIKGATDDGGLNEGNTVTAADLNADGKIDIAVSNITSTTGGDSVTVFLNTTTTGSTTPSFTTAANFTTAAKPEGITAADFSGDGKPDIAVTSYTGTSISVLKNTTTNGSLTASFAAHSDFAISMSNATHIFAMDVNTDNKQDILVGGIGSGGRIIMNTTSGSTLSFGTATQYSGAPFPATFNADTKPDAAWVDFTPTLSITTNSTTSGAASPTFVTASTYSLGGSSADYAATDFNGDGISDILVSSDSGGTLSTFISTPPVDVGTPLAAQNTAATVPSDGQPFRLRLDIGISQANLVASGQSFKLQYASMSGTCDTLFSGETYADVTDTSTVRYYDNAVAVNGAGLITNANDPTDSTNTLVRQTYQELGATSFTNSVAGINTSQDGMWDFALTTYQTLAGQHYCLRVVSSTGTVLTTYTAIPEIITPPTTYKQAGYRFFNKGTGTGGVQTYVQAWGGNNIDYAQAVSATSDGGYVVTGKTSSFCSGCSADYSYIAKYDSSGTLSWSRQWGVSTVGISDPYGVVQTTDGGYVVAGDSNEFSTQDHAFLIKYDSTGTFLWQKLWGGTAAEGAYAMNKTSDGGVIIAGYQNDFTSGYGGFIAKFDSTGAKTWGTTWGGTTGTDQAWAVIQTSDGGYAMCGQDNTYGDTTNGDAFLAKYTSAGALSWTRLFGGTTGGEECHGLTQTSDGGYAITGFTDSYGSGGDDVFVAKYDSTGTYSWSRTWGGSSNEQGQGIVQTSDGGYVIGGSAASGNPTFSYHQFLIKFDSSGSLLWTNAVGGNGDRGYGLAQLNDGGFVVVGSTTNWGDTSFGDSLISKFDSSGTINNCGSVCISLTSMSVTTPTSPSSTVTAASTTAAGSVTTPTGASSTVAGTTTVIVAAAGGGPGVGTALGATNTAAVAVATNTPYRLRLLLTPIGSGVGASGQSFKLQYAFKTGGSCSASTFNDVTTSSSGIRYYDDTNYTGGANIGSDANDPTDGSNTIVPQTYLEANNFSNSTDLYVGQDGEWDFSLIIPSGTLPGINICFRAVTSSGGTLSTYATYPELQFGPTMKQLFRHGKWFDSNGNQQSYFLPTYR